MFFNITKTTLNSIVAHVCGVRRPVRSGAVCVSCCSLPTTLKSVSRNTFYPP